MRNIFAALLLTLTFQNAWAIDISTAKSQGLVGEANTGYLAAVIIPASAEVEALIDSVNTKRQAKFKNTASKTKTTIEQVRQRFYELAIQKTAPGNYYQDAGGSWIKK